MDGRYRIIKVVLVAVNIFGDCLLRYISVLNLNTMPFINFNTIPHLRIWDNIHGALFHSDKMTFGHIVIEEGGFLPEHHHLHEQWTHVIEGSLELTLDGETQVMTPGISVFIPSDIRHSAKALTRCKLIDAFLPVREDFKSLEPWHTVPGQQA